MEIKRTASMPRVATQTDVGLVDIGFQHVFAGHPDVPQHAATAELLRSAWERGFRLAETETDAEWFDRQEIDLMPLVLGYVERVPDREELPWAGFRQYLTLDFGDGPAEYTTPWLDTARSLKPGETIKVGELVQREVSRTAWLALRCIALLRDDSSRMHVAVALGQCLETLAFEEYRNRAIDGASIQRARKSGGQKSGRASPEEKRSIAAAVRELASQRDWPVTRAIKDIAAQLRTGRFPGIDRSIDYSDGYLADIVRNA